MTAFTACSRWYTSQWIPTNNAWVTQAAPVNMLNITSANTYMFAFKPAFHTQCNHSIDGIPIDAIHLIELLHFGIHRQMFLHNAGSQHTIRA